MRILLTEDDLMIGKAIKNALELDRNVVDLVGDFESCDSAIKTTKFDVILLDVNLPDKSGLQILKNLRSSKNNVPVIIITARDSISQKIEGLNLGADDYITKPFDLEELKARIKSVTRRGKGTSSIIKHKQISIDTESYLVTFNNNKINLSPKEYSILKILIENVGKVVSRTKLEDAIYSWDNSIESNAVEVHIHHLRKKLNNDFIETVRGTGYIIPKHNEDF